MTAATLQLQSTGFYLAGIAGRSTTGFSPYHWIQLFLEAPSALETITNSMSGEALGSLSHDDAGALYQALAPAHLRLRQKVQSIKQHAGRPMRLLLGGWLRQVEAGLDSMEDILEALAWGSDAEMRDYVETAIAGIREGRSG